MQADWNGYAAPFNAVTRAGAGRPWRQHSPANFPQARVNRQVLFRRALKLVNGGIARGVSTLPTEGLTVVSENPVYVQGNYNAGNDPVADPTEAHVPAAIIADAVTILSNNWTDASSFRIRTDATSRPATTTGYRFAVVTGKSLSFPSRPREPALPVRHRRRRRQLPAHDGGLADPGVDLNYRGSMVSLFISRQATGTFKYHRQRSTTTRIATSSSTTNSCSRRCCRRGRRCSAT